MCMQCGRYAEALSRYIGFLSSEGSGGEYGLEDVVNTSGFVGLALLDMLKWGVTFGPDDPAAKE